MKEQHTSLFASYPLLLWKTPPGLELILGQEGVAFEVVKDAHPLSFRGARYVLYDSRAVSFDSIRSLLSSEHVMLDIDELRSGEREDPFERLIDHHSALASFPAGLSRVTERVARQPKASIRRRLIARLKELLDQAGGVWIRLAPFPYPYRSAFNFRVDLDEPVPEDYHRFAAARAPLADCCTHFVCTHAYGQFPDVLDDLRQYDTQSHGHFHHVYREPESNRRNLARAHRILGMHGFRPHGFAAPHGRWRPALDDILEQMGYRFGSDFQLGYDDLPYFPWRVDRFSKVLQIPIHPVCEGIFIEAGMDDAELIGEYLARAVTARLDAGQLAIAYGHPENRLGRMPEVLAILADSVERQPLVWRATMAEISRWWHWRAARRWLAIPRDENRLEILFDEWDTEFPLAIEIQRGNYQCSIPVTAPRISIPLAGLAYERAQPFDEHSWAAESANPVPDWKAAIKTAIDWEVVTPLDEIPSTSLSNQVKRGLRWWRHKRMGVAS
jgi:peptidoglycan/xylan/chitin deacetylase (PgdA/CDA1 family)